MAKLKDTLNTIADTVGRLVGTVTGEMEALQDAHPHPMDEVRTAVAQRETKVIAGAKGVRTRVNATVARTKKVVAAATPRGAKLKRRAKGSSKKTTKPVSRARKTVAKARKTAKKAAVRPRKVARRR
jgi:hypothetical protein